MRARIHPKSRWTERQDRSGAARCINFRNIRSFARFSLDL
jgi:hypothetical protein